MFYSSKIFGKLNSGLSGPQVTGIVAAVNFVTTLMSLPLLSKFGRKTLMFWGNAAMAAVLIGTGYCSIKAYYTDMIRLVMVFITLFEFSSGPITWLYMSEIMQDKAQTIATFLNWLMNLGISWFVPSLIDTFGGDNIGAGWLFIGCGGLTTIGTLFILAYMKETMGKSPQEIEEMFTVNREYEEIQMQKQIIADYSG